MERFEQTMEKEPRLPEIYFSVSNLVRNCIVEHKDGTRSSYEIAAVGKVNKDGTKRFQAIGGGAKMTEDAIKSLENKYPDIRFREGEEHDDARFYIPVSKEIFAKMNGGDEEKKEAQGEIDAFGKDIISLFVDVSGDSKLLKSGDAKREIVEELSKETTTLTTEDIDQIGLSYGGVVSPIEWSKANSARADGTAAYFRVFNLHDISVSESIFEKLKNSPSIKIISKEERGIIKEATEQGDSAARLSNGDVIAENIFPDFYESKP